MRAAAVHCFQFSHLLGESSGRSEHGALALGGHWNVPDLGCRLGRPADLAIRANPIQFAAIGPRFLLSFISETIFMAVGPRVWSRKPFLQNVRRIVAVACAKLLRGGKSLLGEAPGLPLDSARRMDARRRNGR